MAQVAFTLVCSVAGLWFAVYLAKWVLQNDEGTKEMQSISNAIREGAEAFLARQYKTIAMLTVPVAAVIYALYAWVRPATPHDPVSTGQLALYVAGGVFFFATFFGTVRCLGVWGGDPSPHSPAA